MAFFGNSFLACRSRSIHAKTVGEAK